MMDRVNELSCFRIPKLSDKMRMRVMNQCFTQKGQIRSEDSDALALASCALPRSVTSLHCGKKHK